MGSARWQRQGRTLAALGGVLGFARFLPPRFPPGFLCVLPVKWPRCPPWLLGEQERGGGRSPGLIHPALRSDVPPQALAGQGSGKLLVVPRLSKAGWRWKTLAIPEAFPGLSAATVAEGTRGGAGRLLRSHQHVAKPAPSFGPSAAPPGSAPPFS